MMVCCGSHSKEVTLWAGLVAFLLGGVILLQMFGVIPNTTLNYLWPSILVVLGLKLMITSSTQCDDDCCGMNCEGGVCEMPMDMPMDMPMKSKKKKSSKKK